MHRVPAYTLLFLSMSLPLTAATNVMAARIEAVPGKEYRLHKQNGPWQIMVASFRPANPDGTVSEGKTPDELAQDLVLELRQKGLPAYTYSQQAIDEKIATRDKLGREETRKLLTSYDQVCVIAGNYESLDTPTAKQTLEWVKKFRPKSLQQPGVSWLETKRKQGPLSRAFLTVNPMLTPEEIAARKHDPLLVKINSGGQNSLFENEGKYTLVIATFSGKMLAHLGDSDAPDAQDAFRVSDNLDEASHNAWELSVALRQLNANIDAYVWHDHYQSIVTVGSFESPQDPKIRRYLQVFEAQPGADIDQVAHTLRSLLGGAADHFGVSAGDSGVRFLTINNAGKDGNETRMWLFDPSPYLKQVPSRR
ncbi:MAG: hypothetical protein KDA93_19090 [Planctomycetaceae bacterium]|nr:hypothetical protein [Planctomycetaceae bacterium]